MFTRLASLVSGRSRCDVVSLVDSYRIGTRRVRVKYEGMPIRVNFVKEKLEFYIYPELLLDDSCNSAPSRFLVFDPGRYFTEISGFLRLANKGDRFMLGNQSRNKPVSCNLPEELEMRHLEIIHDGDALILHKLVSDSVIDLSAMPDEKIDEKVNTKRLDALKTIRELYGGPVNLLPSSDALESLKQVNNIMETEAYRPLDKRGKPGGIVRLPNSLTPIIVGDLHAQVDNILTLLSQNHFMQAMLAGEAVMIVLGDVVHSELGNQLEEMESSLLMMDIILRLKIRFPDQFFYLRGNHDSFSPDLTKFGVAQCLIWEAAIRRHRGEDYLTEMKRFYDSLPYVVLSESFSACHAAPIKTPFDVEKLINIYRYPGLINELTRNRIRSRTSPAGYTRADVKQFRDKLHLLNDAPFIVSHSPMDSKNAYWLEAGGSKDHHIIFSANIPWIGVFTRVRDKMIPLSYHRENLLPVINELP